MRKTVKIVFSVFFIISILLCPFAIAGAYQTYVDGFVTYSTARLKDTNGNTGEYFKVDSCHSGASGEISIKSEINGIPVVAISRGAFKDNFGITQVTVPETVAKIEDSAFENCISIKKVIIQSRKCSLAKSVFKNCSSLEEITLPQGLNYIPNESFSGCSKLASIRIPSSVLAIGNEAFAVCSSLLQVTIPANTISIGTNAFSNCENIKRFVVEEGNASYITQNGCLYSADGKTLIQYPNGCGLTEFSVPSGTEVIGDLAMGANKDLTKVILPESVVAIFSYAFCDSTSLSSINIPNGVRLIGSMAFARCTSLKSVYIPSSVENFESAFYKSGIESVEFQNGVEEISSKAFEECGSLKSVIIPSSVKKIGIGAFDDCTALTELVLSENVTDIDKNAFVGCTSLKLKVELGSTAHRFAEENGIPYEVFGSRKVKSIEINTKPSKTSYRYKESIDTSGLSISVGYNDGTSEVITAGFSVNPTALNSVGTKSIEVSYEGKTCSYDVTVSYAWWQILIRILLLGFLWY